MEVELERLKKELATMKERHAEEQSRLFRALGDSQDKNEALAKKSNSFEEKIKTLEKENDELQRENRKLSLWNGAIESGRKSHTRQPSETRSTTGSIFPAIPDDTSQILNEMPALNVSGVSEDTPTPVLEADLENPDMTFDGDFDRSGSASPTLVLGLGVRPQARSSLARGAVSGLAVPAAVPAPHTPSRQSRHAANLSISTTGSVLSEWEMQEGNSLKLHPEHAKIFDDEPLTSD